MEHEYFIAGEIDEALGILAEKREKCRLVAGATD